MKRSMITALIVICSIIIIFYLWLCTPTEIAAIITPDKYKIKLHYFEEVKEKKGYGMVVFDHMKHITEYKQPCYTCHHKWKYSERIDPNPHKCNECHTLSISDPYKTVSLRNAFHYSCNVCHKKKASTGPTSCKGCHSQS